MYKPKVDIQSNFNENGKMIEQIAVIKDKKVTPLESLSNDTNSAEETLITLAQQKNLFQQILRNE